MTAVLAFVVVGTVIPALTVNIAAVIEYTKSRRKRHL
jgi:hypothetical protein